ncbi:MAG: archease, partial [Candidatus Aenigmatarchaeota archaeon]
FEILEDEATADIAYLAHGESLEELYENAAFGLFSIITDPDKVREMQTDLVSVAAEDREALLLDFLNELLYLWDVEKVLFSEFSCEIREDGELEISAECSGEKFDPERHEAKVEVKAVTYFGMEVTEEDGIWKAKVTLDT